MPGHECLQQATRQYEAQGHVSMTLVARTKDDINVEELATRPEIRCQVDTDLASLSPLRSDWDALVAQTGGDIYFTYDWCCTWWRYYGRGRRLCILSFRDGARLVSLLPLVVERLWVGPVPIRVARLLGADSTTVVLNPPVAPEHAHSVYTTALRRLLDEGRCEAVWFGPLAGNRPHRRALREACQACVPRVRIIRDRDIGVHTIFHLPDTFEQYLAGLDKSQRGNYRRDRRNLDKQYPLHLDCIHGAAEVGSLFEEFLALHEAQWRSQGMLGHFGDWPEAVAFNRDLVRAMAPLGRLRLERLTAGAEVVAYDYSFRLGDRLYWRLPARRTGEPWDRLGLGRVSLVERIEAAITAGIRHIEGGSGHYDYKVRLGATEYPLGSMLIAGGTVAIAKARLLCHWADLLHRLYYKAWFSRIAPRLPLRRRPLWQMWIRSHM